MDDSTEQKVVTKVLIPLQDSNGEFMRTETGDIYKLAVGVHIVPDIQKSWTMRRLQGEDDKYGFYELPKEDIGGITFISHQKSPSSQSPGTSSGMTSVQSSLQTPLPGQSQPLLLQSSGSGDSDQVGRPSRMQARPEVKHVAPESITYRYQWTQQATQVFIDLLTSSEEARADWHQAALLMSQQGYPVTKFACESKWNGLKLQYNQTKKRMEEGKKVTFPFHEVLFKLIDGDMKVWKKNKKQKKASTVTQLTFNLPASEGEDEAGEEFIKNGISYQWTEQQVSDLVSFYTEYMEILVTKDKKTFWDAISGSMVENGHTVAGEQCRNKWHSLVKAYSSHKDNVAYHSEDKNDVRDLDPELTSTLYEQIQKIMMKREDMPPAIAKGMTKDEVDSIEQIYSSPRLGVKRPGVPLWSQDEIEKLINLYDLNKKHLVNVRDGPKYTLLTDGLQAAGFSFTQKQVEEKWNSMLKFAQYDHLCRLSKIGGLKDRPFYVDELIRVLGDDLNKVSATPKQKTAGSPRVIIPVGTPGEKMVTASGRSLWTDEALTMFMELMKRYMPETVRSGRSFTKKYMWEVISQTMTQNGYPVSAAVCHYKWVNMKVSYRKVLKQDKTKRKKSKSIIKRYADYINAIIPYIQDEVEPDDDEGDDDDITEDVGVFRNENEDPSDEELNESAEDGLIDEVPDAAEDNHIITADGEEKVTTLMPSLEVSADEQATAFTGVDTIQEIETSVSSAPPAKRQRANSQSNVSSDAVDHITITQVLKNFEQAQDKKIQFLRNEMLTKHAELNDKLDKIMDYLKKSH